MGLCGGRLFSCMGHSVNPSLPQLVISDETYLVVFLRSPWGRLQSDFYYTRSRLSSSHLGPSLNTQHLLATANTVLEYALYPGIANCATKVALIFREDFRLILFLRCSMVMIAVTQFISLTLILMWPRGCIP
jgi:hypothetical protein